MIGACAPIRPPAVAYLPTREDPVCVITEVVDGDTVKLHCESPPPISARLTGFDTPETHRPRCRAEARLGHEATRYLETRLRGARTILPKLHGTDKYRRALVELTVDGAPLADIMIDAGLAVRYDGGKRINWCARLSR
ncbi:thermonuclease family protein [Actibacterium sp. XHP0104]|uniref:thermonuclease family protein n=1 Tax=Actibacterium sp. XHP0104 TaxID=2984335 RepID=UPI003994D8F4